MFILFLLFSFHISSYFSQEAVLPQKSASCNTINTAYQCGEALTYTVYYNWTAIWLNAGEAKFTVSADTIGKRPVYHLVSTGRSHVSYDWIYKVRDRYESYVDQQTMQPLKFLRDIEEGSTRIKEKIIFDHVRQTAKTEKGVYTIPSCIQDVLSMVYQSRNIDYNKYKKEEKIPISIFLDEAVHPLYIRYLGKVTLKTKKGVYKCIKIRPLLLKGTIFEGGEGMTVWVTDDQNKIPVRIESQILVGSIKVDLESWRNLRNPFSARIE